jgi:hypothetical protein
MTSEHLNTIFLHVRGKHKQLFTFWGQLLSLERYHRKKVSKLRSIAELRAFSGTPKVLEKTKETIFTNYVNTNTKQDLLLYFPSL